MEFLAIKNWEQYQPKDTKNLPWIRDYKDKEFDHAYSTLTTLQRYMLDACCRLRGRHGKNIPNDPLWICRATAVLPRERHNATTAIQQLISSGFLILTNQRDNPLVEESKGENRKGKKELCVEPSSPLKAIMYLPLNVGEFAIEESDLKVWKECYPAVDVMQELRKMAAWCHSNVKKRKTRAGVKRFINSWLSNAQDKFRPEAANGSGKSEQRQQRNDDKYARIEQRISGLPSSPGIVVPSGISGSGNRDVDTRPKLLSSGRNQGSS